MNPEIFAEWLRRQGHRVVRTPSSYWVESGPHVYQAFPYHWLISPGVEEVSDFIQKEKAIAIRYSTPLTAKTGRLSYHVVLERKPYTLQDLPKKARHDVKKGLSTAEVEPITFARLAEDGWDLRRETLVRQGRSGAESESWWQKLCLSAEGLPGFEAWGAVAQGKLVAALLAFMDEECFSILYQQSLSDYLLFGVNNALAYAVTAGVLDRPELKRIFYGLHSLDAPASVDEFKLRMGYQTHQVRQRVEFHPLLSPVINRLTGLSLNTIHRLIPGSHTIAKFNGLVDFYLQGRRPITRQEWPGVLLNYKDAILAQVNQA